MSKKSMKRVVALVVSIVLFAAMLSGCSGGKKSSDSTTSTTSGNTTSGTTTSGGEPKDVDLSLPIAKEPITLKYFINMNSAMKATMSTYAEVECFKKLEELTNIHIEWIHPTGGNEQFALMIASNDLPDLINWPFGNAKGGPEALIRDNVLIPLTDEMLYTYAPNYMRIMDKNPEWKKTTMLDDGTMFQFMNFNYEPETEKIVTFQIKGPYIRIDWVRKVGKKAPETIDELYDVLKAFKDQNVNGKGNVIPFVVGNTLEAIKAIAGSFGTRWSMHQQNGKVVYGPITDEFKLYVEYMRKWYSEGLINSDFPVLEDWGAKILNSEAGFTIGSMGSGLTMQREALKEKDPESDLDSLPYLIGPNGYRCYVDDSGANPRATAITSANKYVTESLRWIDYQYSPEGSLLTTFGIEGVSYEMVNGYPTLTDLVMNNPWGYNQEEAIARFCVGPINYPNARDIRFYEQVNLNTEQKKRIQTNWSTGTNDILMPPITMSVDESTRYSNIMSDINTYVNEMVLKFIMGEEPMENWDAYVEKIKKMDIDKAIAIQEEALKRYNSRN